MTAHRFNLFRRIFTILVESDNNVLTKLFQVFDVLI